MQIFYGDNGGEFVDSESDSSDLDSVRDRVLAFLHNHSVVFGFPAMIVPPTGTICTCSYTFPSEMIDTQSRASYMSE